MALLLLIVNWQLRAGQNGFQIGRAAPKTYLALSSMRFPDQRITNILKDYVSDRVAGVVIRSPSQFTDSVEALSQGKYLRQGGERKEEGKLLPEALRLRLDRLPSEDRLTLLRAASSIGSGVIRQGLYSNEDKRDVWSRIQKRDLSPAQRNLAYQLIDHLVTQAQREDRELTDEVRQELRGSVPPVERSVHPGDVIVEKGETVTPFIGTILARQGYPPSHFPVEHMVLAIAVALLWASWFISGWKTLFPQQRSLFRSFTLVLFCITWGVEISSARFGFYGLGMILLAGWGYLTLPHSLAHVVIIGGGLIAGIVATDFSLAATAIIYLVTAVTSGAGLVLFRSIQSRSQVWKELFFLTVGAVAMAIAALWTRGEELSWLRLLLYPFLALLLDTMLIALLPLWEKMFDVLSPLRLMELSQPGSALLKRLQLEAPGTYHHTLMVGTLAENAADEVGLDGLLVRTGAYYHDIGKLKRPDYFVENQLFTTNPHDEMAPTLSALVIIAHVRDGEKLAKNYKLPAKLCDFITEHHGTTMLSYFYKKAKLENVSIQPEQFTYPGPRPRSRETAIVMLADSVEAAVRGAGSSIAQVGELEELVNDVVQAKISEGQLDYVQFTLADLAAIKFSFTNTLRSMYHSRKIQNFPQERKEETASVEQGVV
ncbi:MAG: HDIG domain-containing protein [Synergistales bacterium]|nr:HDIG domain-containing protein [Synergistales bacterium]